MINEKEVPFLKVSDLNLASVLLVLNFAIDGTDNHNPKKIYFYFIQTPELEAVVEQYWKNELTINPRSLEYARREILNMIHEHENIKKC